MTFPLVREFLCALGEIDFLAVLSLTETSATLYYFIFEQVLTTSMFCDFLRQNQYSLHHDIFGSLFSNEYHIPISDMDDSVACLEMITGYMRLNTTPRLGVAKIRSLIKKPVFIKCFLKTFIQHHYWATHECENFQALSRRSV